MFTKTDGRQRSALSDDQTSLDSVLDPTPHSSAHKFRTNRPKIKIKVERITGKRTIRVSKSYGTCGDVDDNVSLDCSPQFSSLLLSVLSAAPCRWVLLPDAVSVERSGECPSSHRSHMMSFSWVRFDHVDKPHCMQAYIAYELDSHP